MLLAAIVTSVISVIALYSEVTLFVLALIILGVIFYLIYKRTRGELIFAALLILAVTVSGYLTASKAKAFENYNDFLISGEFVVAEKPQNHGDYYSAVLETINSDNLTKGEKIRVNYYSENLEFSNKIKATVSLSGIKENAYKNPFLFQERIFAFIKFRPGVKRPQSFRV